MCGRYYLDQEICPSQEAEVLTGRRGFMARERMYWGFPHRDKKHLIINARAETAGEKGIFRESLLRRRCAVPARHYYEWNKEKERVTFSVPEEKEFYMAGFYQRYEKGDCFVILTTAANGSVEKVHNRMPLILTKKEIEAWIFDASMTEYFLSKGSLFMEKYQEYEQQTLFL